MSAALSAASAEPSSGSRSGRTAGPPRRAAAGMAARRTTSSELRRLSRTNGQGRGVPALAEHRDDVGADVGRRRAGLLDPPERRLAPRDPLGQDERRATEGPVGAARGREKVGQGLGPDGRDDEGESRGRVLRLPGLAVVLEDRAGRLQPLGRPARTRPGAGRRGDRARARPLSPGTRRRRATARGRAPRRDRRCWPGRRGPPGAGPRPRCRRAAGSSSPPRGCGPRRAPGRAPGARSGAPCPGPSGSPSSLSGPPIARSAAGRRPGQRLVDEVLLEGPDGLLLPDELDLREEERGDGLVPRPGEGSRGGPARRGPARLRPRGA